MTPKWCECDLRGGDRDGYGKGIWASALDSSLEKGLTESEFFWHSEEIVIIPARIHSDRCELAFVPEK